MPNPASIRLGTSGAAQVKADLVSIGDTGDTQAKRWARSYERAGQDVEAAMQRQANAAAKINAIMPQTAIQMRINDTNGTGFGQFEGSARQSAAAITALYAEEEKLEQRTRALIAAYDPAVAAQQRFNSKVGEAQTLVGAGKVSLDQYCDVLRVERGLLEESTGAHGRLTGATGQQRQSLMMAGQQVQDFAVQVSSGASPITAFSQQIGQLSFAAQGMGGKLASVGAFLTGPWGIATTLGLVVLGPLVSKLFEGSDALEKETKSLKDNAEKTAISARAKEAFSRTEAAAIADVRALTEELDKQNDSLRTNAERQNLRARDELAIITRAQNDAVAKLAGLNATPTKGNYSERLNLQQEINARKAAIMAGEVAVNRSRIALAEDAAKQIADPILGINKMYDEQVRLAQGRAQAAARAGKAVTSALTDELTAIEKNRQAALKAEQERAAASKKRDADTVTSAQVAKLLRAEIPGVHVTSTTRSAEHNREIGGAPNSYHVKGQAVDFVPAGGMGSMTKADVRKIFESRGIDVVELLGPGDPGHSDHFHVAWTKGKESLDEFSDAAKRAEANTKLLAGLQGEFDPVAEAAQKYHDRLKDIANVAGLTPDKATAYAAAARDAWVAARAAAFDLPSVEGNRGAYDDNTKVEGDRTARATKAREQSLQALADQQDSIEIAKRELALVGANDNYRTSELNKLQLILQLNRDKIDLNSEDAKQQIANLALLDDYAVSLAKAQAAVGELRSFGSSAIDSLFSTSSADSWGDRVKSIIGDLKNELLKLALLNPLKNLLNGNSSLPTISSLVSSVGSLFGGTPAGWSDGIDVTKIARNATGTEYFSGGASLVGELGPEILEMPRGSRITPAAETRRMLSSNDNASAPAFHFDLRGAVVTQDLVDQMNAIGESAATRGAYGGMQLTKADSARRARRRMPG